MVSNIKNNIKPDEQFHKIPVGDLFVDLYSSVQGLTTEQAEVQRLQHGPNDITSPMSRSNDIIRQIFFLNLTL